MTPKVLEQKVELVKNGTPITDLQSKSVNYKDADFIIIEGFYPGEDMEMRPDLLSKYAYGNVTDWDSLLKFNAISNPFSINSGDLILVPEITWMEQQFNNPSEGAENLDILSQYIDPTKSSTVDKNKTAFNELVKSLYNINKNAEFNQYALPPNLAQPGETEITVKPNGNIIFG